MNVWIITTGSSDVQLTTDKNWNELYDRAKNQQESDKKLDFDKKIDLTKSVVKHQGIDRPITRYLAPARAMGIVYGKAITDRAEFYKDLDFPLLNNFSKLLQDKNIVFDRIIVLVTDQANLFTPSEKNKIYCPHWQDTCTLESIIKGYFQVFTHKRSGVEPEFLRLPSGIEPEFLRLKPDITADIAPTQTHGLDDWNSVLKLVQKEFANLKNIPEDATVYVSHQAGTPAISSAVQFMSLARFGKRVKFLVSNEYENQPRDPIDSSEYLRGIKFQEAKALLERHDYSGVKELIGSYLTTESVILLDAAIQWNFAQFDEFIKQLENHPRFAEDIQEREGPVNWWWTAYESAYLGVVRLKQGNTVEAMFHSYRAVEGLLYNWAGVRFQLDKSTKKFELTQNNKISKYKRFGESLYQCFISYRKSEKTIDYQKDSDILGFKEAMNYRNDLFHQLLGMHENDVFEYWKTKTRKEWETKVLGCLNFIAEIKPPFTSLEEASLMFKVHEELISSIAQTEHTP